MALTTAGLQTDWKLLKTVKENVAPLQLKINFKLHSSFHMPWRLKFINIILYVELPTKEAFANVFGLESHWNRGHFFYTFTSSGAVRAQLTLSKYCLGQYVYPLENEDFSIIRYLEVADRC